MQAATQQALSKSQKWQNYDKYQQLSHQRLKILMHISSTSKVDCLSSTIQCHKDIKNQLTIIIRAVRVHGTSAHEKSQREKLDQDANGNQ